MSSYEIRSYSESSLKVTGQDVNSWLVCFSRGKDKIETRVNIGTVTGRDTATQPGILWPSCQVLHNRTLPPCL